MSGIFKGYDVRGIYPSEIDADTVYKIAVAFVEIFKPREVVVGKDARLSSDELADAFIRGVTDSGVDVISIGRCETPMFYYVMAKHKYSGGAMITASHTPKEYNGIKLNKGGVSLNYESGINRIEERYENIEAPTAHRKGTVKEVDLLDEYVGHVLKFNSGIKNLKVVIDAGNGVGGIAAEKVFSKLGIKFVPMFFEPDGNFPNRPPNPMLRDALSELQTKLVRESANIGIAFDADSDRVIFVDEEAKVVPGDLITALISDYLLEKDRKSKIVYDLRSSWIVKETIEKHLGIPIMSRAGHSYIKERMRDENAIFAGELSGHYYYRDNYFADSAIITAVLVCRILTETNRRLSSLIKPYRKYAKTEEISFKTDKGEKMLNELEQEYADGRIFQIDGLTVEFDDWWFNLRQSQTEPLMRLNIEAKTPELLEEVRKKLIDKLKHIASS